MIVREYIDNRGRKPFRRWISKIDKSLAFRIRARLLRIETTGNLGDFKLVKGGNGVCELRLDFGKGYRIYFGRDGDKVIILLVGGDKKTQNKDIKKAVSYWEDYNA